jgi:hypothetical protein
MYGLVMGLIIFNLNVYNLTLSELYKSGKGCVEAAIAYIYSAIKFLLLFSS